MDSKKFLKGAAIAAGGALLTYATEQLVGVDFGTWTPAIVAIASALINGAKLWLQSWSLS